MSAVFDPPEKIERLPVYTVEALLKTAAISQHSKVVNRVGDIVRVKGEAVKVNVFNNRYRYVMLKDRDFSIKVRVDIREAFQLHEIITVEGVLFLNPRKNDGTLETLLTGSVVGRVSRSENEIEESFNDQFDKTRFCRLESFLSDFDLHRLLILGSQTAITDVFSQLSATAADSIAKSVIRVSAKEQILKDLNNVDFRGIQALALVRGGDDPSMNVWNDAEVVSTLMSLKIPFYTALGHSHSLTLSDRYADESFPVPNALGAAINECLVRKQKSENLARKCQRLENQLTKATQESGEGIKVNGREKLKVFGWGFIVCLVFVFLAINHKSFGFN